MSLLPASQTLAVTGDLGPPVPGTLQPSPPPPAPGASEAASADLGGLCTEQSLCPVDMGRRASDCRLLGSQKAREGAGHRWTLGVPYGTDSVSFGCVHCRAVLASRLAFTPVSAGVKARVRLGSEFVTF